jgi:hypothetical protein
MIYMWFTGINWPLRKIASLFLRPYGNHGRQICAVKTTLRFFRRSETSVCNYSVTHRRVGSMNYILYPNPIPSCFSRLEAEVLGIILIELAV